ncbi:MAG TPA: SigE family RNA polymerase sigma factor [Arachnia sp.]|nr:SigE family RNA polymerase sigma factor [Arachnia sp.]HMT84884.1 SigE family RNA polymerase sigma factor [Arachnia sp.]
MTEQIGDGFDRFVAQRSGRLWRAAWLLTGDRHKAEDLVQTALAKTYGRYEMMADDEAYEAYLRVTLYRTYVSWWRRRWNAELPTADLPEQPAGTAPSTISLDVTRALAELPRMQRAVLVLRFFEDRSVADVADALGIAEGSVKTHTSRGCARLRGSLHLTEEAS